MSRDLLEVLRSNGNVVSSSQLRFASADTYRKMAGPMEGIILEVKTSDDPDNLTSTIEADKRGHRHECTVLVIEADGEPNLLLENVVIPPSRHSGIDDYEEDLPKGVKSHLDKKALTENWKHLDISRLDGEHCIISFVGDNIDKPYISNWWPHPANKYDPATSGKACLVQADPQKEQNTRSITRTNGVVTMISKDGDIYVNTNEAASILEISPKYKRLLKDVGGSVQLDVKKTQQLEINWNVPVEGLKAGSNSSKQTREPELPHADHAEAIASPTPPKRETTRTFIRHKQFEMFEKTSNYTVSCANTEDVKDSNGNPVGKPGEYVLLAEDTINLYIRNGDNPVTTIHMEDGTVQIINSDGTQIGILGDEIQIITKSGGMIDVKGTKIAVAGQVDVSGPMAVGGPTGQPTLLGTTFSTLEKPYLNAEFQFGKDCAALFTALAAACSVPPLTPLGAKFSDLATAFTTFSTAAKTLDTVMPQMMSKNLTTS